ncbi:MULTISPECIES: aKG-HExxH-type peptide beta-hydroxylase [Burkholderia]|uniref:HEXXH motif-containing protein n=1 Tax=Burkholderia savannae TaxID=1637837 RepID=A0ABR5TGQ8_9BURK|nr:MULTISPECIES: HEXXH motif-containing putative peptide modification protein [Burkholderia]AOJ70008.1 hypothetical protein WS78_15440 [Burkholderia savannae]AOJ81982.1 hypothetical protein WS86_16085 [Burkholderia savannae]AOK48129.1 hypothetical protein WT60_15645 [Burkholderia sp. MSMB617WGS]KVG44000.1 hypothetical protein WS77_10650 [Burkholderia sp. MSMB0265]KVG83901.1 hypothetical protein WS81_07535 [Burkholderia sp. MSMB2040]
MKKIDEIFHGLPFLDEPFKSDLLLTLIGRVRKILGDDIVGPAIDADWLDPDQALKLRGAAGIGCDLPLLPLSALQLQQVRSARASIVEAAPEWQRLILFPVKYHRLDSSDVIGCSCYATPQRVFLSDAAFATPRELCEQIIHEHCHNWMYFLEELMPFHRIDYREVFVLPSGTANRNPTEVIGAAHVAATLAHWYARQADAPSQRRVRDLLTYLDGCVGILRALPHDSLLPAGAEIASLLARSNERFPRRGDLVS